MASSEAPVPTLRQGIRIAPPDGSITVEEVLLAIGNQVGHENLLVASRMNKAVVVFLKAERIVNDLVESGVVIRDLFVQVSPLSAPSTRVIVSGVPPFIPNALLENELRKFGKFASGFKTAVNAAGPQSATAVVGIAGGNASGDATAEALVGSAVDAAVEVAVGPVACPLDESGNTAAMQSVLNHYGEKAKSYWHFNNKLLQDNTFCQDFRRFWEHWRLQKLNFSSLRQWWEVDKAQTRVYCQQYTSYSTARIKTAVRELEADITHLEKELHGGSDPDTRRVLQEKRLELSSFLHERIKGALVRSRLLQLEHMDAPSSFFFNLEKSVARRKQMTCLKLPGGRLTSNPSEMRRHAVDFYSDLFSAEDCNMEHREKLLDGLPQLAQEELAALDSPLTLEELTDVVNQMATGRAPGIDGLSIDFFKRFWNVIGPDLHAVFMECLDRVSLPVSCQRAVLSLLPKKGDLALLKNWRPVALLCTDYKVLSRALSNRLKDYLGILVNPDQTYCVPDRTIMDNVFLMRDLIDLCSISNVKLEIISLDQEKAFDRVDHSYLFSVLKALGIGDEFLGWLHLLYNGAECMVKMGAGLSRPIPVRRGIRQGCPISGQLYSLVIEPLLCRLRSRLGGVSLPGFSGMSLPLTVSAYADDLNVFVTNQWDAWCLEETLSLYEEATSAKVNWAKSEALLVGQWRGQQVPSLPGGLQWGKTGLKVLGVYLGSEGFQRKNWEGVREKVCARLSKWKWLLPQMSYRGRVLVSNNLVASTLWHKLTAMTPPSGLIEDIQKIIVDFFWSGRHWVRAAVLYLPVAEGGQGLIDIHSKIASFRLYTAQKLLYGCGSRWLDTSRLLLRRVGRFGYDKHLFFLRAEEVDCAGLTSFYYSVLQAWQVFKIERVNNETPGMWVFEEPLFFNNFIRTQTLQSTSLRTSFREAGCTKVGHLMKMSRPSLTTLREATGIRSIRLLGQGAGKKVIYQICVKVLNLRSLTGVKESRWTGFLGQDDSPKGSWQCLYKLPIEKRTADLQWRVVHGAIATNRYRARLDPSLGDQCVFCSQTETLEHLFIECPRLSAMFDLLRMWFQGFG
ncbi:hypothetical protein Q8A73_013488 [Channa argus]|nr:hypothetical protein Q8A73_013488 [Channa argus]